MSSNRTNHTRTLTLGGVFGFIAVVALAQQADEAMLIEQPIDRDVYAAHREINVQSSIDGDFVAAGRRVIVDGAVTGDIIVAAQDIEIRSVVSDDLRAAGQHIRVMSPVSGHIVAAGQSVTIEQKVGDWAWLAGNTVEVLGDVGGDLKIRARQITIDAEVAGNVELVGDELNLGPNAVVSGDLRWRSRNAADISPDARIDGEFIEEPLPGFVEELTTASTYSLPLSLIVAVTVLFLIFSRPLRVSADQIATRPGALLLLGFAVLCVAPVLAVLLFFTGVGVWLGFAVLLVYLVMLLLGLLTGLFAASDIVLRRFRPQPAMWQSLVAIFVIVVAVGLLAKIPRLGFVFMLAIWLTGVGTLFWNSWATLKDFGQYKPQSS